MEKVRQRKGAKDRAKRGEKECGLERDERCVRCGKVESAVERNDVTENGRRTGMKKAYVHGSSYARLEECHTRPGRGREGLGREGHRFGGWKARLTENGWFSRCPMLFLQRAAPEHTAEPKFQSTLFLSQTPKCSRCRCGRCLSVAMLRRNAVTAHKCLSFSLSSEQQSLGEVAAKAPLSNCGVGSKGKGMPMFKQPQGAGGEG